MGRVMQGLVSDFAANEDLGKAFREQIVSMGSRRCIPSHVLRNG
jgi:hypothetical protein